MFLIIKVTLKIFLCNYCMYTLHTIQYTFHNILVSIIQNKDDCYSILLLYISCV